MPFEIGARIKKMREAKGISQKQLAELLCISNARLSNWELGYNRPDVETLAKICIILNVSADVLLDIHLPPSAKVSLKAQQIAYIYDNLLNANGQEEMRNHTDYIASQDKYKKDNLADEFSEEIS